MESPKLEKPFMAQVTKQSPTRFASERMSKYQRNARYPYLRSVQMTDDEQWQA
jgi:hypothetical protein